MGLAENEGSLSQAKTWTSWEQSKGKKGRIDAATVEQFITDKPPIAQSTEYYICAPSTMNISIRKTLMNLGIPKALIHIEQFGGNKEASNNNINSINNAQLTATLNGKKYSLEIPKGKTILQTLKEAVRSRRYEGY